MSHKIQKKQKKIENQLEPKKKKITNENDFYTHCSGCMRIAFT